MIYGFAFGWFIVPTSYLSYLPITMPSHSSSVIRLAEEAEAILAELQQGWTCEYRRTKMLDTHARAVIALPRIINQPNGVIGSLSCKHGGVIIKVETPLPIAVIANAYAVPHKFAVLSSELHAEDNDFREGVRDEKYRDAYHDIVIGFLPDYIENSETHEDRGKKMLWITQQVFRSTVGSMLWWNLTSRALIADMDSPDTSDGDRILYAKRARVAHAHYNVTKDMIETEMGATVTIREIETV